MRGTRSQEEPLAPFIDNINRNKDILAALKEQGEVENQEDGSNLLKTPIVEEKLEELLREPIVVVTQDMVELRICQFSRPTVISSTSAIALITPIRDHELKP